jgi:hypothetical protein
MHEDFEMYEDLEQWLAQTVSMLTSEEYERFGPALQEAGLAIAELRLSQRELQCNRQRTLVGRILGLKRAQEGLCRSGERVYNARLLLLDAE